jgi:hypothetical protein
MTRERIVVHPSDEAWWVIDKSWWPQASTAAVDFMQEIAERDFDAAETFIAEWMIGGERPCAWMEVAEGKTVIHCGVFDVGGDGVWVDIDLALVIEKFCSDEYDDQRPEMPAQILKTLEHSVATLKRMIEEISEEQA